jgi:4-hydroxybenzoate polyprenyltransferase
MSRVDFSRRARVDNKSDPPNFNGSIIQFDQGFSHLKGSIGAWFKLVRPHQWIKNGFVLIGLVFSRNWLDLELVSSVALAFSAFCAVASAVYVFNDLLDVESDRKHPTKCLRPIASGRLSLEHARVGGVCLLLIGMALAFLASPMVAILIAGYALLNLAYTLKLKQIVIVDVFVISVGFMLRLLVGTIGVGIPPSSWLVLCGMTTTLFLGFAKRRAELIACEVNGTQARKVLLHYRPEVLDQFLSITAGATVLTYALYTVSAETISLHRTDKLIYTVPFVLYGIFRYVYLLHGHGQGQDTSRDLLTDKHLLFVVSAWLSVTAFILA